MVLKWTVAAAVGGCVVQSFGYFVRNRERATITYTSHYRKAITLARENIGVEYLFGKPLEIKVSKLGLDAATIQQCLNR